MEKFVIIEENELKKCIKDIFEEYLPKPSNLKEIAQERKILYSIRELAEFLKCSIPTASKLKNEGIIPFIQWGPRKIQFDSIEVMEAFKLHQAGSRKRKIK